MALAANKEARDNDTFPWGMIAGLALVTVAGMGAFKYLGKDIEKTVAIAAKDDLGNVAAATQKTKQDIIGTKIKPPEPVIEKPIDIVQDSKNLRKPKTDQERFDDLREYSLIYDCGIPQKATSLPADYLRNLVKNVTPENWESMTNYSKALIKPKNDLVIIIDPDFMEQVATFPGITKASIEDALRAHEILEADMFSKRMEMTEGTIGQRYDKLMETINPENQMEIVASIPRMRSHFAATRRELTTAGRHGLAEFDGQVAWRRDYLENTVKQHAETLDSMGLSMYDERLSAEDRFFKFKKHVNKRYNESENYKDYADAIKDLDAKEGFEFYQKILDYESTDEMKYQALNVYRELIGMEKILDRDAPRMRKIIEARQKTTRM